MKLSEHALGFELTPSGWRAVHLRSGLRGTRVIAAARGPLPESGSLREAAAAALEESCRRLEIPEGARLGLAIARPIGHLKRVGLPRASRAEILEAVRAQSSSLFPVGADPVVADVRGLRYADSDSETGEGLVAVASEELIEALSATAQTMGLELGAVDLSAGALRRVLPSDSDAALIVHESGMEWVEYRAADGVELSRYFPQPNGDRVDDGQATPKTRAVPPELREGMNRRTVTLLGPEEVLAALTGAPDEPAGPPQRLRLLQRSGLEEPELAMAYGAALEALGGRRIFDLRPLRFQEADSAAGRRRTYSLIALAALAVLAYWLAGVFALHADVTLLDARVADLEQRVESALDLRDAATLASRKVEVLERLQAAQPRWTLLLAEIAGRLPRDAYVTGLVQREDGLRMEGYARSASAVVDALQSSDLFASVRLAGPVSRERSAAGQRERFSLDLSLVEGAGRP